MSAFCCSFCQECFSPDLGMMNLAPFNSQLYCHLLRENFPNLSLKQLPNLFILYLITLFSCMSMNTLFLKRSFYWFIAYFCLPTLDYKTAILSVLFTATFLTYTKSRAHIICSINTCYIRKCSINSLVCFWFWFEATQLLNLAAQKNYLDIFLIIQTLGPHPRIYWCATESILVFPFTLMKSLELAKARSGG